MSDIKKADAQEATAVRNEDAAAYGRMKGALQLIHLIAVSKSMHLGYERRSGIGQECVACIAALGLGLGEGACQDDFDEKRERMLEAFHERGHAQINKDIP